MTESRTDAADRPAVDDAVEQGDGSPAPVDEVDASSEDHDRPAGPDPEGPSQTGPLPADAGPLPSGTFPPGHPPASSASPDSSGGSPDVVDDPVAAALAERDQYLDSLQRLQAEFENFKKRMIKQQTDTLERAGADLVAKVLPVLDTIDLARQHGFDEGVEQVAASLMGVLEAEGLERIDPVGKQFDPNEHDAVAHEDGDGAPEVVGLMRAGYRWRGRLLRPAMVSVKGS